MVRVIAVASQFDIDERGIDAINEIKAEIAAQNPDTGNGNQNTDDVFIPDIPDTVPGPNGPPSVPDTNTGAGNGGSVPGQDFVNGPIQQPASPMKLATAFDR
jgi:hypothetical protein